MAAKIPTFIRLFEARANDIVRSRKGLRRTTLSIDGQFTDLPTDLEEFDSVWVASPFKRIEVLTLEQSHVKRARFGLESGTLESIVLLGTELEAFPAQASAVTVQITYHQTIPPLVDDDDKNWLLDAYPDLYLYGSLIASAPYLRDDSRLQVWVGMHDARLIEVNRASERSKVGGTTMRRRFMPIS